MLATGSKTGRVQPPKHLAMSLSTLSSLELFFTTKFPEIPVHVINECFEQRKETFLSRQTAPAAVTAISTATAVVTRFLVEISLELICVLSDLFETCYSVGVDLRNVDLLFDVIKNGLLSKDSLTVKYSIHLTKRLFKLELIEPNHFATKFRLNSKHSNPTLSNPKSTPKSNQTKLDIITHYFILFETFHTSDQAHLVASQLFIIPLIIGVLDDAWWCCVIERGLMNHQARIRDVVLIYLLGLIPLKTLASGSDRLAESKAASKAKTEKENMEYASRDTTESAQLQIIGTQSPPVIFETLTELILTNPLLFKTKGSFHSPFGDHVSLYYSSLPLLFKTRDSLIKAIIITLDLLPTRSTKIPLIYVLDGIIALKHNYNNHVAISKANKPDRITCDNELFLPGKALNRLSLYFTSKAGQENATGASRRLIGQYLAATIIRYYKLDSGNTYEDNLKGYKQQIVIGLGSVINAPFFTLSQMKTRDMYIRELFIDTGVIGINVGQGYKEGIAWDGMINVWNEIVKIVDGTNEIFKRIVQEWIKKEKMDECDINDDFGISRGIIVIGVALLTLPRCGSDILLYFYQHLEKATKSIEGYSKVRAGVWNCGVGILSRDFLYNTAPRELVNPFGMLGLIKGLMGSVKSGHEGEYEWERIVEAVRYLGVYTLRLGKKEILKMVLDSEYAKDFENLMNECVKNLIGCSNNNGTNLINWVSTGIVELVLYAFMAHSLTHLSLSWIEIIENSMYVILEARLLVEPFRRARISPHRYITLFESFKLGIANYLLEFKNLEGLKLFEYAMDKLDTIQLSSGPPIFRFITNILSKLPPTDLSLETVGGLLDMAFRIMTEGSKTKHFPPAVASVLEMALSPTLIAIRPAAPLISHFLISFMAFGETRLGLVNTIVDKWISAWIKPYPTVQLAFPPGHLMEYSELLFEFLTYGPHRKEYTVQMDGFVYERLGGLSGGEFGDYQPRLKIILMLVSGVLNSQDGGRIHFGLTIKLIDSLHANKLCRKAKFVASQGQKITVRCLQALHVLLDGITEVDCVDTFNAVWGLLVFQKIPESMCYLEWYLIRIVLRFPVKLFPLLSKCFDQSQDICHVMSSLLIIAFQLIKGNHQLQATMSLVQLSAFYDLLVHKSLVWNSHRNYSVKILASLILHNVYVVVTTDPALTPLYKRQLFFLDKIVPSLVSTSDFHKSVSKCQGFYFCSSVFERVLYSAQPLSLDFLFRGMADVLGGLSRDDVIGGEVFRKAWKAWQRCNVVGGSSNVMGVEFDVPLEYGDGMVPRKGVGLDGQSSNIDRDIDDNIDLLRESSMTEGFVQRKIVPWESILNQQLEMSGDELDLIKNKGEKEKKRRSVVIVATLVSKNANLGGLCRSCETFNAELLVLDDMSVISEQLFQSTSVTSDKWMPMLQVNEQDLIEYLLEMKGKGYSLIGIEQATRSIMLQEFVFPEKAVLVLGKEKLGLSVDILSLMDFIIEIPQSGLIKSLNVHVAASLVLWEYVKQDIRKIPK